MRCVTSACRSAPLANSCTAVARVAGCHFASINSSRLAPARGKGRTVRSVLLPAAPEALSGLFRPNVSIRLILNPLQTLVKPTIASRSAHIDVGLSKVCRGLPFQPSTCWAIGCAQWQSRHTSPPRNREPIAIGNRPPRREPSPSGYKHVHIRPRHMRGTHARAQPLFRNRHQNDLSR